MINKTIWLDHQQAYILEFNGKKINEKRFYKAKDRKLTDSPRRFQHAKEHQKAFYHALALELGTPNLLLILGPGVAREEFHHHCQSHHHEELSTRIISSSPAKSHPRRSELIKISKTFFNRIH